MGKDYDVYVGNTKVGTAHQQDTMEEIEKRNADKALDAKIKGLKELEKGIKEANRGREAYRKMDGQSRYEYDKYRSKAKAASSRAAVIGDKMNKLLIVMKVIGVLTLLSFLRVLPMISYFLNCLTGYIEFEMTGEMIGLLLPSAILLFALAICTGLWVYWYYLKSKADRAYSSAESSRSWLTDRFK